MSNPIDPFEQLMRRSNPAPDAAAPRELDARARADLLAITAEAPDAASKPPRAARGFRWPLILMPAFVAALLTVVFVLQPWNLTGGGAPAVAAPRMLDVTKSESDLDEVLEQAIRTLSNAAPSEPIRRSESEGWYIQINVEGDEPTDTEILPQRTLLEWNEDLSGIISSVSGLPYEIGTSGAGRPSKDSSEEFVFGDTYGPGEFLAWFQQTPPSTAAEMREYLATGASIAPDADSAAYVNAVQSLLGEWTLGPAQHAAILSMFSEMQGLVLEGTATDRLGRDVIVVRVHPAAPTGYESQMLLSAETQQIIGMETIYVGGIPELNLEPPVVASYIAWK